MDELLKNDKNLIKSLNIEKIELQINLDKLKQLEDDYIKIIEESKNENEILKKSITK
jgi:hypothetical protein